jgi:hypothetical protein
MEGWIISVRGDVVSFDKTCLMAVRGEGGFDFSILEVFVFIQRLSPDIDRVCLASIRME